jgi:hypothetical protein
MKALLTPEQFDIISEFGCFQDENTGYVYMAYWSDDHVQLVEGPDDKDFRVFSDKIFYDDERDLFIFETENGEIALRPMTIAKNVFSK